MSGQGQVDMFRATNAATRIRDAVEVLADARKDAIGYLLRSVVVEAMARGLDVPQLAGTDAEQIRETLATAYQRLDDEVLAATVAGMVGELERREHARREAAREDGHDEPPPDTQPSRSTCKWCNGWGRMVRGDDGRLHAAPVEPQAHADTEPCPECGVRGTRAGGSQ